MPLLTSLKCSDCGEITQTAKVLRPGDTIPCNHCGGAIQVGRSRRDPVEDVPAGGSLEPDLLRELLAGDEGSPGIVTSQKAKTRYQSVTNEPLPPATGSDPPFVRNPLAPAGARSKERLIGGKGVRFTGSREFTAVVVIVAVLGVGYLTFWGLHDVVKETEKTGNRFAKQKEKEFTSASGPGARRTAKGKTSTPPPSEGESRAEAGNPVRIGVTEVTILSATRAAPGALNGPGGLMIALRITNHDANPIIYYKKQLTLRDRGAPPKDYPLLEPPADNPKLAGKQTVDDVLVFGPTSMMSVLDLDLRVSGSDEKFQFFIPAHFIKTSL